MPLVVAENHVPFLIHLVVLVILLNEEFVYIKWSTILEEIINEVIHIQRVLIGLLVRIDAFYLCKAINCIKIT